VGPEIVVDVYSLAAQATRSINMISFTFSAVITRLLNSLFPGIIERTGAWKISAHLSLANRFQTIELGWFNVKLKKLVSFIVYREELRCINGIRRIHFNVR